MAQLKPNITLYDKSFNKDNAASYHLHIELGNHALKQTILDTTTKTFISLEVYSFDDITGDRELSEVVESIIDSNDVYRLAFRQVKLSIVNNRSTLIPNAVYDSSKLAEYHKFNFAVNAFENYFADRLINLGAANVYSVPESLYKKAEAIPNAGLMHFSSALIEAALLESKHENLLSSVNVNVLQDSFQITVVKDQKLNLYNTFKYTSDEDFIYYLLFVLDQQEINNEEAIIRLTGNIDQHTSLFEMLHKYIHTITFGSRPTNLSYSYILEEIPSHYHYSLFNQFLCE